MTLPAVDSYPLPTAAEMPAPRVPWTLHPDRAVLLLHDLQEHFLDAYGERSALRAQLLRAALRLRDACDRAGVPVVYTAQPAHQDPADRALLTDFWGEGLGRRPHRAQLAPDLAPREGDTVLTKWRYSAFHRSELAQVLAASGRDQLVVAGVYAGIGCQVTACEAFMRDVQPFLVGDAVADFDRERHDTALRWVAGTCGVVLDAASAVRALTTAAAPAGVLA
ncbi:isochorismatase family protein [Kineococcus sp. SYSU DK018]|uniref:isochorismatase family protein n=1 Tax=Kineococcus sp. SYSU DK018 TaxID=3383139 RepID=UPI003D7CA463